MMEFIKRLGKKVQELFDKIFGKEEPEPEYENQYYTTVMAEDNEELKVALENLKADVMNTDWSKVSRSIEQQPVLESSSWSKNELEKFVNITYPFLPKRIPLSRHYFVAGRKSAKRLSSSRPLSV